jgi:hypothetical protein
MANDVLVSFKMVGDNGESKAVLTPLISSSTLADALAYAQAMVPILEAISDGYVESAAVQFELDISGQTNGETSGDTRTNDGARFSFDTAGRYSWGVWIPAFKPGLLADTEVKTDEAVVLAFTDGITGTIGGKHTYDGNGNLVGAIKTAKYAFRK